MRRFSALDHLADRGIKRRGIKREVGRIEAVETLKKIIKALPSCPVCLYACGIHNWAVAMEEKPTLSEMKDRHAMAKMAVQMRFDWTGRAKADGRA